MSFLRGHVSKLRDGTYTTEFVWQDLDETTGTLAELREWVESLIKEHGEACKFEVEHPEDESGRASYHLSRAAKPEEIADYEAMQAKAAASKLERERVEFERLKAQFEGKPE